MRTFYNSFEIKFTIDNIDFYALNFVFEQFLRSVPAHSHGSNSYEIHYIPYGQGQVKIDNVIYEVTPNTLYVTGPYVEHEQIPLKTNPMAEYCIYLKVEVKDSEKKKANVHSYVSHFEKTKFWFGQDRQNIYPLMKQIFYELENQFAGYMTQIEALLKQLVVHMIRNYENKRLSENHFETSNLGDSKYLIIEECFLYQYQNITLETLSKRLQLGPRQTERLLKKHYNKTFLQKRTEAKMSAIVILLMDKSKSISDISNESGYSSVEHFSYAFKKHFGVSAREYRKNLNTSV